MSIHYLLDGYNIIHKMPISRLDKLEDQRRGLIRYIEEQSPQGSRSNRVTVVFDGSLDAFGGMKSSAATVIFSQGESADDRIRAIVEKSASAKNIAVISDDREIQYAVRALGAKAISVKEFLSGSKRAKQQKIGKKRALKGAGKYISKSDEARINSEMGTIWLKTKNTDEKNK